MEEDAGHKAQDSRIKDTGDNIGTCALCPELECSKPV